MDMERHYCQEKEQHMLIIFKQEKEFQEEER
jgi:hypothetical protein